MRFEFTKCSERCTNEIFLTAEGMWYQIPVRHTWIFCSTWSCLLFCCNPLLGISWFDSINNLVYTRKRLAYISSSIYLFPPLPRTLSQILWSRKMSMRNSSWCCAVKGICNFAQPNDTLQVFLFFFWGGEVGLRCCLLFFGTIKSVLWELKWVIPLGSFWERTLRKVRPTRPFNS